jgi:hypothetical protein
VNAPKTPPRTNFIGSLVENPAEPPAVRQLAGFLGDSPEPEHTRLYLDAQLSDWIDVPDADFVHWVLPPADREATDAALVWLREGATIRRRASANGATSLERYVTGSHYSGYLTDAAAPRQGVAPSPVHAAGPERFVLPTQTGVSPCPRH